jgi:hypothetical protein
MAVDLTYFRSAETDLAVWKSRRHKPSGQADGGRPATCAQPAFVRAARQARAFFNTPTNHHAESLAPLK